jgi:hypothetical protein
MGIANLHDYMARVEQAVRDNLGGATVLAIIEDPRMMSERDGYWERAYHVAWQRPGSYDRSSGTHRAHIDSDDKSALFMGHYEMTPKEAVTDCILRSE